MSLDYRPLRKLTAQQIIRALLRDDFVIRNQAGAHIRFVHADGRRVTVSFHKSSQTFPPKTLKSMLELQARWTAKDLKRLKLLK